MVRASSGGSAQELRRGRGADVIKRVPLERTEREIGQMPARLQVAQKAAHPGVVAMRIRPCTPAVNVGLKARPAEAQRRVGFVEGICELNVQRPVVLRRDELPVRLLPHLNLADNLTVPLPVTDLGGGVFGSVVEEADRGEHRQAVRQAAVEDRSNPGCSTSGSFPRPRARGRWRRRRSPSAFGGTCRTQSCNSPVLLPSWHNSGSRSQGRRARRSRPERRRHCFRS